MQFVSALFFGAIIGVANIIPGVSGGTMAVILNIYDKLIAAVSRFRENVKKNLLFLVPLALGAGIGIVAFSWLIKFVLAHYPAETNFLFMGLVVGSIPMIYKRAAATPVKHPSIIAFLVTLAIMIGTAFLPKSETAVITVLTAPAFFQLFISSALAAACMILPGISGSMIMVILGAYTTVLGAIADVKTVLAALLGRGELSFVEALTTTAIPLLIPIGLGVLVGLLGGAKVMDLCLRRFPQTTFFAILGLMVGSMLPLFQKSQITWSIHALFAVLTFLAGAALSLLFASERFQRFFKREKKDSSTAKSE